MATFADRQRINREANRPAIKFNQRDNIRDFARSGHGQNYNRMMDIQRQLPNMDRNDPMVQEFKDRRRMLNRYGKNPMGEMLGYTPHEMMDKYVDLSRDVRQTNKPVYNKMYPLTGGFMDYMDQGATFGMLKNAATDILSNVGIGGALDTNEEELRNYANLTYPQDVHPGPTYYERPEELGDYEDDPNAPIQRIQEEIYGGPRPHEGLPVEARDVDRPWKEGEIDIDRIPPRTGVDVVDDITVTDQMPGSFFFPGILANLFKRPEVIEGYDTTYIDEPVDDIEQRPIEYFEGPIEDFEEPLPFDQGKEDFIRSQNEYVSPPPVFPGNVRQDPQETDKWLRYLTAPELGSANPQGDFDKFQKYPFPKISVKFGADNREEPPPFNDDLREAGIASMMQSGLNLAGRRPYEDEYRAFVESSGPSKVMVTYEDFMEYYLPRIQESRGVLRAPLNSQGRR